jgi:hypothetical protein
MSPVSFVPCVFRAADALKCASVPENLNSQPEKKNSRNFTPILIGLEAERSVMPIESITR